ncbi:MAG: hypothetical protein E6Q95_05120, partial [Chitinophagaceae bacterium]
MVEEKLKHKDADLLERITNNDYSAFEMLYNRYWELVYNTAYKRLNDSGLCKDIVQDLFLDIWERRNSIQIENFPGYVNKATKYIVYKI